MIEFKTLRTQIDEYIQDTFRLDGSKDLAQKITDSVCLKLNELVLRQEIRDFYLSWESAKEPEMLYKHGVYRYHLLVCESYQSRPQYDIYSSVKLEEPEFDMNKFMEFYDNHIESGIVTEITDDETSRKVLGDMITVELKENFKDYDMYWPSVIRESEEIIKNDEININFEQFPVPLENLQKIKGDPGEIFESQELTVRTRFGRYSITEDLFSAENYNEFLYKIVLKILPS